MPWKEVTVVNERMQLIAGYLAGEVTVTELCYKGEISRKTAYKWIARYAANGPEGLLDRSRARHNHPNALPEAIAALFLQARRAHPTWGPRKLIAWLAKKNPAMPMPAASTVGDLLKRQGFTEPRQRRRRVPRYNESLRQGDVSNAVWAMDYKGQFRTGDGRHVYPFTVTDTYSRYLLECKALTGPKHSATKRACERLFLEFGLPDVIRSDNGVPFCSPAPLGLSRLSIWWLKLGVKHERIDPGCPTQNGRHERMHRTLKQEATKPPKRTLQAQQKVFDAFIKEYNEERPHEALSDATPASIFKPSVRLYTKAPEPFTYAADRTLKVVAAGGRISWKGHKISVGAALAGENLSMKQLDEQQWQVEFGPLVLGTLNDDALHLGLIRC